MSSGPIPARTDPLDGELDERAARRRIWAFVALTLVALAPAVPWLLGHPGRGISTDDQIHALALSAFVGLLFLAAELVTVDIELRHDTVNLSFSLVPMVLGFAFLPPWSVVAMKLGVAVLVMVAVRHQRSYKVAVNLCAALVELLVVAASVHLVPNLGGGRSWAIVLVGGAVADLASGLLVAGAISTYAGRWEEGSTRSMLLSLPITALAAAYSLVLVALIRDGHPEVALAVVVGALLVSLVKAHSVLRARHARLRLLDDFTRALARAAADGRVVDVLLDEAAELLHADRAMLLVRDGASLTRIELEGGRAVPHAGGTFERQLVDGHLRGDVSDAMVAHLPTADHEELILVVADRSGELRDFDADDLATFETLAVHAGLALQNMALVDRLQEQVASTEHMATHDPLTELPNRALFQKTLDGLLANGADVAVLLLDLDRFKEVNDTLGHHNGDRLLVEVGTRIRRSLAASDMVARLGGDEFAAVIPGCTDADMAAGVARRIIDALAEPVALADVSVDIGASIGVAVSGHAAHDGPTLLRQADVAMYCAKADATQVEVYTAVRDHYSPQRLALVSKLRRAIDDEELVLVFQPQVELATGAVFGAEALVRWPQPGRRDIPPDDFIYIAEHTGLIRPLSQLVLRRGVEQAAAWHRDGRSLRVSVNLSAPNLSEPNLVAEIAALLDEHQLPPELLSIEVTESVVMANPVRCVAALQDLRELGIGVAIDDFGTGHSSLAYLTSLPATELKIDKSFVWAMATDPAAATLVGAIVDLGRNLGFDIVAEGVETQQTADSLRGLRCAHAQGFFFARPMAAGDFERWLAATVLTVTP